MFRFANPEFLILLVPSVFYLIWWTQRKRPGLRYSDVSILNGLPRGRAGFARWMSVGWRAISLIGLALAIAGPRIPDLKTRLPAEGIAVVVAMDVSGSMGEEDFTWTGLEKPISRLTSAKRVLRLFAVGGEGPDGKSFPGRPSDSLGLVTFAAWPEASCPLTLNHSVFLSVLDTMTPKIGPDAGTNIGDAIAEGVIRLDAAGAGRKILILVSDGEHNIALDRADPPLKPRQATQLAADLKIPVYTIDCGGEGNGNGDAESVARRADGRAILKTVAEMTGGKSFMANDGEQLQAACLEIDRLERRPVESFTYRRERDLSPWFAGVAMIALVVALFFEHIIWRTIPS